eukprot:1889443-Amphidinium_carterae.1
MRLRPILDTQRKNHEKDTQDIRTDSKRASGSQGVGPKLDCSAASLYLDFGPDWEHPYSLQICREKVGNWHHALNYLTRSTAKCEKVECCANSKLKIIPAK